MASGAGTLAIEDNERLPMGFVVGMVQPLATQTPQDGGQLSKDVDRFVRSAGLPELRRQTMDRPVNWSRLLFSFGGSALFFSAIFSVQVLGLHRTDSFLPLSLGSAMYAAELVYCGVIVLDETAGDHSDWRLRWLFRAFNNVIFLFLLLLAAWTVLYGFPGTRQHSASTNVFAGDLAIALAIVGAGMLAANGGRGILTIVGTQLRACLRSSAHDVARALPEMFVLAVFVAITPEVWKVLGSMSGWRVEVLLLGFIAIISGVVYYRVRHKVHAVATLDAGTAVDEARRQHDAARNLIDRLNPGQPVRSVALNRHSRFNVAFLVVFAIVIRLLLAGTVLFFALFLLGMVAIDPAHGQPYPEAAAKVAAILAGLAVIAVSVSPKIEVPLQHWAATTLGDVRIAIGVWLAYQTALKGGRLDPVTPGSGGVAPMAPGPEPV